MEKKNLIMGIVKNYWWYKIEPFYVSCAKYNGDNCDIVAFTKNLSKYTYDRLHELGIHTIDIPDSYEKTGPIDYRYGLYIRLLEKKRREYDQVIFCDTRDVFFQSPLFPESAAEEYLGTAIEQGRIMDDEWNDRWMRERFGMEAYEELKEKQVLCAGTIWGSSEVIYHFCQSMIDCLEDPKYNFIDINDQTSFQYMVYKKMVPYGDAKVHGSTLEDGPVATIGTTDDYRTEGDVLICKADNRPALIHQWDRHADLKGFVRRLYTMHSPRIRWSRYKDHRSLKDIALSSYHDHHILNMGIATLLYFFSKKPAGEHLWN